MFTVLVFHINLTVSSENGMQSTLPNMNAVWMLITESLSEAFYKIQNIQLSNLCN